MEKRTMTATDFEGFRKVVFLEDWANLSKSASAKKGVVGYVTANYGGYLDVAFLPEMEGLVTSNVVNMLGCCGVPTRVVGNCQ